MIHSHLILSGSFWLSMKKLLRDVLWNEAKLRCQIERLRPLGESWDFSESSSAIMLVLAVSSQALDRINTLWFQALWKYRLRGRPKKNPKTNKKTLFLLRLFFPKYPGKKSGWAEFCFVFLWWDCLRDAHRNQCCFPLFFLETESEGIFYLVRL